MVNAEYLEGLDDAALRRQLRETRLAFRRQGGRGIAEAELIDWASAELRRRRQRRYRRNKATGAALPEPGAPQTAAPARSEKD